MCRIAPTVSGRWSPTIGRRSLVTLPDGRGNRLTYIYNLQNAYSFFYNITRCLQTAFKLRTSKLKFEAFRSKRELPKVCSFFLSLKKLLAIKSDFPLVVPILFRVSSREFPCGLWLGVFLLSIAHRIASDSLPSLDLVLPIAQRSSHKKLRPKTELANQPMTMINYNPRNNGATGLVIRSLSTVTSVSICLLASPFWFDFAIFWDPG